MSERDGGGSGLPRQQDSDDTANAPAQQGDRQPRAVDGKALATPQAAGFDAGPPATDDRRARWFGIIVILLAFGGVGGWASTAPIDGAVVAKGTVTIDTYRKTVQHLEGGIVEQIHVRDGDEVDKGELLVQLDETQARAEYLMNWNRYISARAREARLRAEMDGADSIDFPTEVTSSAEQRESAERVVRTQKRQFETRREALEGEIEVLEQRVDRLNERVDGMQAQRSANRVVRNSLQEELDTQRGLAEDEVIPRSELLPLERQVAELDGTIGELKSSIAGARIEAGETQLQIIQRRREYQSEVSSDLSETSDTVDELEEELQALRDTLRRKQIRAPVSGVVVNLRFHTDSAVIGQGEAILDIVPEGEPLVVEGRVDPQDVDNVGPGQAADVRFTAFSFRSTPVVEGEVTFVSADSLQDEESDESYYKTRVTVPDDEMAKLAQAVGEETFRLRPGMPADIMIQTGERTPAQYLAKPITDALARAFKEE